ncbi:TylR regulatory protein-like protein [Streptantibioticus cattleyicolor NRRL 8057 = DSM 46488]|uniref:TylR regulatory protein-like protein n=1 Tax=Streptantibioticus cattleyicolor (strain ATCC 35852 / DSM 46488 / JCM 4925 / NBRC 14057 / NRRL 8057) TaxID=1003195 RepID=G8X1D1_STREN|nr:TylR regulatory protein-like protein [Streptantibioticus cattleyicolor NRRL 8057 = DSM 46488]
MDHQETDAGGGRVSAPYAPDVRTMSQAEEESVAAFARDVFAHLPRADQRRWAQAYLRGLLALPGKKSIRRLAQTVAASPTAAHSLQQFVNQSPWEWMPSRQVLARQVAARLRPQAWVAALTVIPKRGEHSVGVHRRFVPEAGRTLNCQVGIGLFLACGPASLPVDWRLYLGGHWAADPARRTRARVPDDAAHRPVWAHVLDLADTAATAWNLPGAPLVAALPHLRDITPLATALTERRLGFLLEISPAQPVLAAAPGTRPHTAPRLARAGDLLTPAAHHRHISLIEAGTRPRHLTARSGPVHLPAARTTAPAAGYRLLAQWTPADPRPAHLWLTNLHTHRLDHLLTLTRHRTRTETALRTLESDFGLLDFEGRSYPGWHHHMTLVSAAYAHTHLHPAPPLTPQKQTA